MEKIIINGNVGKEPTVKDVNGKQYTSFSVGVYTGKDKPTNWYEVMAYGDQTSRMAKGQKVLVMGRPTYRMWAEKVQLAVWADQVEYLSKVEPKTEDAADSDMPF